MLLQNGATVLIPKYVATERVVIALDFFLSHSNT